MFFAAFWSSDLDPQEAPGGPRRPRRPPEGPQEAPEGTFHQITSNPLGWALKNSVFSLLPIGDFFPNLSQRNTSLRGASRLPVLFSKSLLIHWDGLWKTASFLSSPLRTFFPNLAQRNAGFWHARPGSGPRPPSFGHFRW